MSKISEKWETVKPYAVGLAIGLIAAPVIGLWHGGLVTSGTRDGQVQTARIDAQALICERLAREYRVDSGDTSELTGYGGRGARNELAARFAVMPGEEAADTAVQRACADKLAVAAL
jgi:hypothetical protein